MNKNAIKSLISNSRILTDAERAYWSASLSKMTSTQMIKLEGILQRAESIPWTAQVQKYFSIIASAAEKLT
ncbi:hypothetical protein HN512_03260 [Candidatus Peregrinibacteria bacterium]|jgi:hypothetical protein|nr:hypothetical protein [Candidatus Peregrinibacteria bacterium]MBT3598831.1 hypothetical protein [Candidatus Peregrinibacteria bacterium]MBT4366909.1 hypothetical protein [Candidatus Peregrinibacteria bacterium]MBT4585409.1 hypothetical protein [Candidatus Peregrinibacteria bacterium]MBT6731159.1 hypothetical protein [Candidatus Peregrinibacteria bacterium]